MTTQSPKTEVSKRMEANVISEDAAWIRICDIEFGILKRRLGRKPLDWEWLEIFNTLVEHWRWVENKQMRR